MLDFQEFIRGFLRALLIFMFIGGIVATIIMGVLYVANRLSFEWIHILAPLSICLASALWNGFDLDD